MDLEHRADEAHARKQRIERSIEVALHVARAALDPVKDDIGDFDAVMVAVRELLDDAANEAVHECQMVLAEMAGAEAAEYQNSVRADWLVAQIGGIEA